MSHPRHSSPEPSAERGMAPGPRDATCVGDVELALALLDRAASTRDPVQRERYRRSAERTYHSIAHLVHDLELPPEHVARVETRLLVLRERLSQ